MDNLANAGMHVTCVKHNARVRVSGKGVEHTSKGMLNTPCEGEVQYGVKRYDPVLFRILIGGKTDTRSPKHRQGAGKR